jgi:hypothetical protein
MMRISSSCALFNASSVFGGSLSTNLLAFYAFRGTDTASFLTYCLPMKGLFVHLIVLLLEEFD